MKKLRFLSIIVSLLLGVFLTSCEEVVPYEEPCVKNNTGTFIVQNTTGYVVYVDVDDIAERRLSNGGQTTYSNVPAGSHRMYIDLGNGWQYKTQYLKACETLTYTWYLQNKKSTEPLLCLDIIMDGVIIDTVTDFERDAK